VVSPLVSNVQSKLERLKLTKRRCAGCAGAAAAYPLQSWIFAHLLTVITPQNDLLPHASAHWALIFFILGIGAGVAYFTLGWSSTTISTVGPLKTCLPNNFLFKKKFDSSRRI
jgi:hypothetical protein